MSEFCGRFGMEVIIDLTNCLNSPFTRKQITRYYAQLCVLIDMEREDLYFWDYRGDSEGYENAPPHLKGISAVQFIKTSSITIHTLDDLRKVFINVFSCKDFDVDQVVEFSKVFFNGHVSNSLKVLRQ